MLSDMTTCMYEGVIEAEPRFKSIASQVITKHRVIKKLQYYAQGNGFEHPEAYPSAPRSQLPPSELNEYYWNEQFQLLLERPTSTPEEVKQRFQLILD